MKMKQGYKGRKLMFMLISAMLCLALVVAGCSSGGGSNSGGSQSGSTSGGSGGSQGGGSQQPAAPQNEGPPKGGILRVGTQVGPNNLGDPTIVLSQNDPNFAAPAVERLFRRDSSGTPVPYLAEKYEVSDDQLSITIWLKQGIQFHDGAPFNAEAVKWNLDRYIATGRAELAKVKDVAVVDEYTVKLSLSEYDSLLLSYLSAIPGMMVSPKSLEEKGSEWADANPVGTGPYKIVRWEKDDRVIYERNDNYWQEGMPYLDGIEMIIIPDAMSLAAAFMNGEVDVVFGIDPKTALDLQAAKFQVHASEQAASMLSLLPDSNNEGSVYTNLKVRQAVAHAIDFEAIAKTLGNGFFEASNQLAVNGSWAYNPNVKGYPYDPEKAKQLLAEAGYPNGFSTTLYAQNTEGYRNVLTAVQAYLKEVGINAEVDLMDQGRYHTLVTGGPEKGGWKDGLAIIPFTINPNELGAWSRLLGPEVSHIRLPSVYNPDPVKELIAKATVTSDQNELIQVVHELQRVQADEFAMAYWIYGQKSISANQDYVYDTNWHTPQWTPELAYIKK